MKKSLTNSLLAFLTICLLPLYVSAGPGDTTSVRVHDAVHMNWWGEYNRWGVFPAQGTTFGRINLDFTLSCPPTGCSDWDYTVQVEALHKTGALDSTAFQAPFYTVDGVGADTIYTSLTPTWEYFYNSATGSTDSVMSTTYWVMIHNDGNNPVLITDSLEVYPAGYYHMLYDATGTVIDSVLVPSTNTLINSFTTAYNVFEVVERIELARVITPYGGYYPLSWNNTLHFDITDLAPILHDSVEIRAFYGGWSDGFAITLDFHFIEGTPPRTPLQVRNIYSSGPGGFPYGNASNPIENYLVPKTFNMGLNETQAMIRFIPTGHGAGTSNCSEFCSKQYRIKLDGVQQFQAPIWRSDCGTNHLYHQAGTWIYDRANWCPGEKGLIKEHEITGLYTPGNNLTLDMDMDAYTNSVSGQNPNYIMAAQLITYGPTNHSLDASMETIISPNNDFYYNRSNGICNNPVVAIKNSGATQLTSVTITYGIKGAAAFSYQWNGTLDFGQIAQVQLSGIDWNSLTNQSDQFYAYVSNPNGGTDQYAYNDTMYSTVKFPATVPSTFVLLFKTNNAYFENTYNIKDDQGNVVFSNGVLAANIIYRDTITLNPGCYTFTINDSGKDGLSFFANNDGNGYARLVSATGAGVLQFFEPDFGTKFTYQFTIGYTLSEPEIQHQTFMEVFPNPSSGTVNIDLAFDKVESGMVQIFDAVGKLVYTQKFENEHNPIITADFSSLPAGVYYVTATASDTRITKKLILQP